MSTERSRQEIGATLAVYCRSLDRMDRELMSAVFHPAATVRYPKFAGTWSQFVDWVWGLHRAYECHSHQMSNVIIGFTADGHSAVSESYVSASLWAATGKSMGLAAAPDGAGGAVAQTSGTQTEVRARYLDDWSYVDGRWAIDHRTCVVDFKTEVAATGLVGEGRRDEGDPSYAAGVASNVRTYSGAMA